MQNLNSSLTTPLSKRASKWFVLSFLVFSLIGFIDASYLTVEHFLGVTPNCSVITGCEEVLTSPYSVVFGVPMALLGAIYYLLVFLLSVYYFDSKKEIVLKVISFITIAGFVFSLYLAYLMIFVIGAICIYCVASIITSTLLFVTGMIYLLSGRKNNLQIKGV